MASSKTTVIASQVDRLIEYVDEQIELLAFDTPEPDLLRRMVESLADTRVRSRIKLIESFVQIGEPATPFLLDGIANHPDSVVRRACCNALTNIDDPLSVPGLVAGLVNDSNIGVKSSAAAALAKIGEPAFEALRTVLASETADEACKGHAAWAIASMSHEVSDRLYTLTSDPFPTVRTAAIGALAQLAQQSKEPNQKALTTIAQALTDSSSEVRIEAAANIARLNYQAAYQPLINGLEDTDSGVRKSVVLALAKLGNAEAINAIAPLTQDADISVQKAAELAIRQLQKNSVISLGT